jgi:ABC-type iron transport system FetAB ATPase subunit
MLGVGQLALEGFEVGIEGRPLFHPIDLTVGSGERVALVGPSGSGKSTLLRAVARLLPALGGRLMLDGRAAEAVAAPRWRRRVLLVAQTPSLRGPSVRSALAFPFGLAVSDRPFPEAEARAGLARLGLSEDRLDQDPASLSVGERQRVALVRALLLAPAVWLLDEPTSALDPRAAARVEDELSEASAGGAALLFVTHDPAQAERLGTRVLDLGTLRREPA